MRPARRPPRSARGARAAAACVGVSELDRTGSGDALLLWRTDSSEAWVKLWWQPRDTGYHDHDGSCVGVHVIAGRARNEPRVVGEARRVREYGPGESFAFPGSGIHRMEHDPGAVTIHSTRRRSALSGTTRSTVASCAAGPVRPTSRRARVRGCCPR